MRVLDLELEPTDVAPWLFEPNPIPVFGGQLAVDGTWQEKWSTLPRWRVVDIRA